MKSSEGKITSRLLLSIAAAVIAVCVSTEYTGADLLGILAGPTINNAMDRAEQLVSRARDAALAIEAQTNLDVSERLKQVQDILNNTEKSLYNLERQTFVDATDLTNKIDSILGEHEKNIASLERTFMNDLSTKIREVECTTDRILQQQLKDALGKVGIVLGTNEIRITPPVLYEGEHTRCGLLLLYSCRVSRTFTIYTPFTETYREINAYLEDRLASVRDDTPVASIIDTNALIADMAKRTTCFTLANDRMFEAEFVKYSALIRNWNSVLVFGGQL
jgi:predicted amino acid-binding ACT domain protein